MLRTSSVCVYSSEELFPYLFLQSLNFSTGHSSESRKIVCIPNFHQEKYINFIKDCALLKQLHG